MGEDRPKWNYKDAHNKGQEDGAKGHYDPPSIFGRLMMTHSLEETSDAYDKGYDNARNIWAGQRAIPWLYKSNLAARQEGKAGHRKEAAPAKSLKTSGSDSYGGYEASSLFFRAPMLLLYLYQMFFMCIFDNGWRGGVSELFDILGSDNYFFLKALNIFGIFLLGAIIQAILVLLHPLLFLMVFFNEGLIEGIKQDGIFLLLVLYGPTYVTLFYTLRKT